MTNYYFLSWSNSRQAPIAFTSSEIKAGFQLIPELDGLGELPFKFDLVKLTETKTGLDQSDDLSGLDAIWLDYMPNNLAWPLMSEKLKTVISGNLTGNECINWIRARVNGLGEKRDYYILRFEKMLDVLDEQKTVYNKVSGSVIRPHFSIAKVSSLCVFHKPLTHNLWKITSGIYVSEVIKKAIQKEKLSGISFNRVGAS